MCSFISSLHKEKKGFSWNITDKDNLSFHYIVQMQSHIKKKKENLLNIIK